MLTFTQFVAEELKKDGIILVRKPDDHNKLEFGDPHHNAHNVSTASWQIHHPHYGHLGDVDIESNPRYGRKRGLGAYDKEYGREGNLPPIHQAHSATLTISTVHNPEVPEDDIGTETMVGPRYKIGPGATRHIFRHIKKTFPNLRRIENSERVSGARSHVNSEPGKDHYDDKFRYPVFKLKKEKPTKISPKQQNFEF